MNKVYVIFNGCYSDIGWHGFFLTEEEARAYCDWKNQYARDSWDEYWYSDVDLLSLKKEQKETTRAYKVIAHDYEIGGVEPLRVGKGTKNEYMLEVHEGYYSHGDFLVFEFIIVCDSEDKAKKITYDTLAQLREKYAECEDWDLAMSSIGGTVF